MMWQSKTNSRYCVMAFDQGNGLYACDWYFDGKQFGVGFSCTLIHLHRHFKRPNDGE